MCKPLAEGEREQRLTSLAVRKLKVLEAWDWGRVLTYVYWLCLVCWVMIFFSKMTVCIHMHMHMYVCIMTTPPLEHEARPPPARLQLGWPRCISHRAAPTSSTPSSTDPQPSALTLP